MTTLNTMVKRCAGLLGTGELSEWEEDFMRGVLARTRNGDDTRALTERQVDSLERIFEKHYGDAQG